MEEEGISHRHLVAMPYPGRGHINPMFNLCSLLLSSQPDLLISFVVTQEWFGFLSSEPLPSANLRLIAVPQVVPSEIGRAKDLAAFIEAVNTKLQDPFERLLDRLEPPATGIIYDTFLSWVIGVSKQRNIPAASLSTQSPSIFNLYLNFDLLLQNRHSPIDAYAASASGRSEEKVDYIPGLCSTTLADLPTTPDKIGVKTIPWAQKAFTNTKEAECVLFTSVYEVEEEIMNALKAQLSIPIYCIGPMIPHWKLHDIDNENERYFQWLDSQPQESVLYISQGSFLSFSSAQMEEIVAGIRESGVRFLWVTRGDCSLLKQQDIGEGGCLVPWCDQLKVLCHPSVGGFWTHCGWNSTLEGIYAGVPMLTCPIIWDQLPNSKQIVSDWKIGWRVMKNNNEVLVTRHEIAQIVTNFMDSKCDERQAMVNRAISLRDICRKAIANGGSAASDLHHFVTNFTT